MTKRKPLGSPAAARLKAEIKAGHDKARRTATSRMALGRNCLNPDLLMVDRDLDTLKPAPRRVRRSLKAQVGEVARSISAFGVCRPGSR